MSAVPVREPAAAQTVFVDGMSTTRTRSPTARSPSMPRSAGERPDRARPDASRHASRSRPDHALSIEPAHTADGARRAGLRDRRSRLGRHEGVHPSYPCLARDMG